MAAAKKKEGGTFTVYADIKLNAGLDITASSFEDAVSQAAGLKVTDFVTIVDELMDNDKPTITGIYKVG